MHLDKTFDCAKETLAQSGFVRAAGRRRDQVDIGFAHDIAVFGPGDDPGGAFAFGKAIGVGMRILFAFEQGNQGWRA